jgi:hypothetical protein
MRFSPQGQAPIVGLWSRAPCVFDAGQKLASFRDSSLSSRRSVRPTSESPTTPNRARISQKTRKFCNGAVRVAVFRTFSAPTGRAGPAAAVPVRQATFSPGGILRFRYCPDRPPTESAAPPLAPCSAARRAPFSIGPMRWDNDALCVLADNAAVAPRPCGHTASLGTNAFR